MQQWCCMKMRLIYQETSMLAWIAKDQLISKAKCQAVNSSKKRTNEFIFTTMRRVFVCFDDTKKFFWNYLTFTFSFLHWYHLISLLHIFWSTLNTRHHHILTQTSRGSSFIVVVDFLKNLSKLLVPRWWKKPPWRPDFEQQFMVFKMIL